MTSPCLRHGCDVCCWDTQMPLTQEDVARLAALGHDAAAFSRVAEDGTRQLRTRDAPDARGRRPCFFLVEGKCSVYAHRPAGCRTYPFVLTLDGKVVRDEDCPFRDEFPREADIRRRLLRIAATVARESGAERGREP